MAGADLWELKIPVRGRGDHGAGRSQRIPDFKVTRSRVWDLARDIVKISAPGWGLCPISVPWDTWPGLMFPHTDPTQTPSSAPAGTYGVCVFMGQVSERTLCFFALGDNALGATLSDLLSRGKE